MDTIAGLVAEAVIGIDTIWGGDMLCASGTVRFIADSWFSDEPLPGAYTSPAAERVRKSGGLSAKDLDREGLDAYVQELSVATKLVELRHAISALPSIRRQYLENLALSIEVMHALALQQLGKGDPVAYEDCVIASTNRAPEPSKPQIKREQLRDLLGRAGYDVADLLKAVDQWRGARNAPMASVRPLGASVIAKFDQLSAVSLVPYLPRELGQVPRANIEFLPIKEAWFSGSMNYVGRARNPDGSPRYEATYEINASLQMSYPEFEQLVSHEVVPGHVTTFAYLQNLYVRGLAGFEATVLTMNTRAATLFEGIANNAILIAYGVTEIEQLPDEDLQIGVLLALLQDDAKNQSSYMTWGEKREQQEVAQVLRRDFLVSEERADKLSGAWGRHPLLGRMYLPAYRTGTEKVAELRRTFSPEQVLPAMYGCHGMVDIATVDDVLAGNAAQAGAAQLQS